MRKLPISFFQIFMMKKILSFFVVFALVSPVVFTEDLSTRTFYVPLAAAQSSGATQLKIEAPATAVVGEAFDVTVTVLDKDGKVATGYNGSIVFATEWIADTVPMPGRPISFTAEDAGVKKFSKWVTFKKAGKQKLSAYDLTNDVSGEVTIDVQEGAATTTTTTEELQILTPSADSKITGNTLVISGKARKNSKISLSLNGQDIGTVVSDNDGLFTKEVSNISQENNILKASLMDASNAVIASSPDVKFSKSNESSSIYGLSILPGTSVAASTGITLTIDAIKGLSSVTAMLDNTLLTAKETSEGKYTISTTAPLKAGSYPIKVTAKTITGQETSKDALATLVVTDKPAAPTATGTTATGAVVTPVAKATFKNVKTETKDGKVTFTFGVDNAPTELKNFKISYGAGSSVSGNSVTTQDAQKILKDGLYTWYIDKLTPGDYTFKIEWQSATGSIAGLVSENISATIGTVSCTISNVGNISVKTDSSKSVLTWDAVPTATAYNVYKIDANGKYNLLQKVTTPSYTIFLSQGAVSYDNFAVKALCGDGTESKDYSQASKVQTGPGAIAFVVILSGLIAAFILRRKSAE